MVRYAHTLHPDAHDLQPGDHALVDESRGAATDTAFWVEVVARRARGTYVGTRLTTGAWGLGRVGERVVFAPEDVTQTRSAEGARVRRAQLAVEAAFGFDGGTPELHVVGVGQSADEDGAPVIEVLVHGPLAPVRHRVESLLLDVPVRIVPSGEIVALAAPVAHSAYRRGSAMDRFVTRVGPRGLVGLAARGVVDMQEGRDARGRAVVVLSVIEPIEPLWIDLASVPWDVPIQLVAVPPPPGWPAGPVGRWGPIRTA